MRKNEIVNLTLITRVLTSAVGITLDWAHVCLKKSGPGRVWDAYTEQQSAAIFDGRELRCRIIKLKIFTSAFYHAAGKPIGWLGLAHIISFISVLANRWECEHTHKTIVDTNEENLKMVASRKDGSTSISFRVTWRVVAAIPYLQNSAGESRKETGKPEKYILRWIETVARKNVRGGCSFAGFALNTSKIYFTLYLKQSKWHNCHTFTANSSWIWHFYASFYAFIEIVFIHFVFFQFLRKLETIRLYYSGVHVISSSRVERR